MRGYGTGWRGRDGPVQGFLRWRRRVPRIVAGGEMGERARFGRGKVGTKKKGAKKKKK